MKMVTEEKNESRESTCAEYGNGRCKFGFVNEVGNGVHDFKSSDDMIYEVRLRGSREGKD
jgi:hypothetical protein